MTTAEIHSPSEIQKRKVFDALITKKWGSSISPPKSDSTEKTFENYEDDDELEQIVPEIEDTVDANGNLLCQQPAHDQILNAKVCPQLEEEYVTGKVKQHTVGPDGKVHGTYDENPYLNMIVYDVEFPDGQVKEYSTNLIAKHILSQCDTDGYSLSMMDAIIDYKKDEHVAVPMEDKYGQ